MIPKGHSELERFWEEPGGHILLTPELIIEDVGQEYARRTWISPEKVVGKPFFDIFPNNPRWRKASDGPQRVRESMGAAMSSKIPDKMAVQRYDIRNGSGDWETRWWLITHIPVLGDRGELKYLVQRIEDVTTAEEANRKIKSQRVNNYVLYILVLVAVTLIVHAITRSNGRLDSFRHNSCLIQKRGLPAGRELTSVMNDIHKVLTFPPIPSQQRDAATLSPNQRKYEVGVVRDLNHHLVLYNRLESQQPQTVSCP